MDRLLNVMEYFVLGDQVKDNLWECTLKYVDSTTEIDSTPEIEVSALQYESFEDARLLFDKLCRIHSPYVTKPHGLRRVEHNQGIVIVEKIHPFSDWLNNNGKPDMWKLFGDNRTFLGIGYDFARNFQQILWGLESIHELGYRHGALVDGVFTGNYGNIRLSNFLLFDDDLKRDDSKSLKADFKDFLSLVQLAIENHPPPAGVKQVEVVLLEALFNFCMSQDLFEYKDALWMYSAPIFWDFCQKKAFFFKLCSAFQNNFMVTKTKFNIQIKNWDKKIKQDSPLHSVLCHPIHDLHTGGMKFNSWYMTAAGIVVFIRNYCAHSYILVDPFNEIELIFPGITCLVYNELVMGSYISQYLNLNTPKNHQTLQVETVGSSGVCQYPIQTYMSVLEYLNGEVSIWGKR